MANHGIKTFLGRPVALTPDDLKAPLYAATASRGIVMPTRYLLDTNICIYIQRQKPEGVLARFQKLKPGDAGRPG